MMCYEVVAVAVRVAVYNGVVPLRLFFDDAVLSRLWLQMLMIWCRCGCDGTVRRLSQLSLVMMMLLPPQSLLALKRPL